MKPPLLGTAIAVAAAVTMVILSHARISARADDSAAIRVSWSARPERVETCRRLSDEELAKVAEHMRRRVECEGTTARYWLEVLVDGIPADTATVRGGGLRHDRELYVAREVAVAPGVRRIRVRFARLDSSTSPGGDEVRGTEREDDERRRRRAEAIPAQLALDTVFTFLPSHVGLVTYDALARRLVLRERP